ncbi:MAG: hypothetical protein WBH47_25695, partial [Streptosporangiaceae bacterium]
TPPASWPPPSAGGHNAAASRPDWTVPAAWSGSAGNGSPAGPEPDASPAHQPGRADADPPSPAHAAASGQHRSGLPIRQPRTVSGGPLSPSGSLWEPATASSGSLWEPATASSEPLWEGAEQQLPESGSSDTRPADASRPMFVWGAPGVAADNQTGRSAD